MGVRLAPARADGLAGAQLAAAAFDVLPRRVAQLGQHAALGQGTGQRLCGGGSGRSKGKAIHPL